MILGIIDTLEEWVKPFRDFVFENSGNPLMWLGFFLIGILVFKIVYDALSTKS